MAQHLEETLPAKARDEGNPPAERAPDVQHGGDLPIGAQLAWRLETLIRSGGLEPGARLPGVRDLAAGAGVNVNTARAVYRRLEGEGLAISIQGSGTFVAPTVRVSPALSDLAAEAAEAAREQGINPRELARALYVGSSAGDDFDTRGAAPADALDETALSEADETAGRRSLRGQIARLEAELAAYPAETGTSSAATPVTAPAARIVGLGELERVRDGLVERLKQVRAEAEEKARHEGAARRRFEAIVRDPAAHKFETVSNEEMGEPGCTRWEARPAFGPVGALMNWWRVKVSSGCPLAAPLAAA